jgi:murein DD-endopeptidase MepM/ murein hydrolase activator NlpD
MRRLAIGLGMTAATGLLGGVLVGAAPAHAATVLTGTVATGHGPANLREAPSPSSALKGTKPQRARITLVCRATGPTIHGYVRTTNQWDRIASGYYISDGYVRRGAAPPVCPAAPAPANPIVASGWMVPVNAAVGDGFRPPGRPTHQGVDLLAARNTPILAAAAGVVVTMKCNASTNNCNVDGGANVAGCGWYVEIQHADQVITRYCHMGRQPLVSIGQQVSEGQVLGYVGSSGHSSGPHLHFEVHIGTRPAVPGNAIDPVAFMAGKGAPLGRH